MKSILFTSTLVFLFFSCSTSNNENSAMAEKETSEAEMLDETNTHAGSEKSSENDDSKCFSIQRTELEEFPNEYYKYINHVSPNKKVELDIEDYDPMGSYTTIVTENYQYRLVDEQLSPGIISWSENSKYAVMSNEDFYAGSGTIDIPILNVETGECEYLNLSDVTKGLDVGEREMLVIEDIIWVDSTAFILEGYVGFLGYSGHPGIDQNRKSKLGDNFGNEEESLRLKPALYRVSTDKNTPTLEERSNSLLSKLNGSWYSNDDPDAKMKVEERKLSLGHDKLFSFQEKIILSNFCLDPSSIQTPSKDINCINAGDFSYSVVKLTKDSLDLIYLNGRGNTLSYARDTSVLIKKSAILKSVDETGTDRRFTLTASVAGKLTTIDYRGDYEGIRSLVGKPVVLSYAKSTVNEEVDVRYNGTSIFGKGNRAVGKQVKKVEGELHVSGVSGDSPDFYSLTLSNGEEIQISSFIGREHLRFNASNVTVFYLESEREVVKFIEKL